MRAIQALQPVSWRNIAKIGPGAVPVARSESLEIGSVDRHCSFPVCLSLLVRRLLSSATMGTEEMAAVDRAVHEGILVGVSESGKKWSARKTLKKLREPCTTKAYPFTVRV